MAGMLSLATPSLIILTTHSLSGSWEMGQGSLPVVIYAASTAQRGSGWTCGEVERRRTTSSSVSLLTG